MTNEMKLLQQLCKTLGFEVETIIDRKERKENKQTAMAYNSPYGQVDRRLKFGRGKFGNDLDIDKDGMYTSYLIEPVISYKLTRTEEGKDND